MKLNVISFADSLIKILIVLIIDIPFIEVSFLFFIFSSLKEFISLIETSLNEVYYIPLHFMGAPLRSACSLRSAPLAHLIAF